MKKIKWYEIKNYDDIEKANFNYQLPKNFYQYPFYFISEMERARKLIIDELKIAPKLKEERDKFVEHLQYISIVWARKDLSNEEKFNLCSQHWDGKETIELLAQRVLERLCVLVIHINDFEYLLDSIYLFSDAYTRFLHKLEQSERNSKAGKASYKKYESLKQKTFEYAQDLLNKSKTKYTANALADKITNAYLLGNIPEIKFNAENPKPTIYKWLKNEFPCFTNNEKKI